MAASRVGIAIVHGPVEAVIVREILDAYGIRAELVSAVPHSFLPCRFDEAGRVEVRVDAEDAELASEMLARHRRSGLELVRGGAVTPGGRA